VPPVGVVRLLSEANSQKPDRKLSGDFSERRANKGAKRPNSSAQVNTKATAATPGHEAAGAFALDMDWRGVLARSFTWAAAGRAVGAIGNVFKYALFARLLTPYDFGVATTAFLTLEMLWALTNPSFDSALIQQRDEIGPFLDTVWTTTVVRGALLAAILTLVAHPMATFFHQREAYTVYYAIAPLALVRSVQSPAWISLYRRMEFHFILLLNAVEIIGSLAAGISAILIWRDWRGLVVATIAGQACRTILTYWYFPYLPRIRIDLEKARRLFRFGRWISGTAIAEFAAQQIDNFVVAHLLGPQAVGDYQIAFRIGEMPTSELAYSAAIVTFPVVARSRGRIDLCRRLFFLTGIVVVGAGVGYALLLLGTGNRLIGSVLGTKWLGAVPALKFLCFYGLFQGILTLSRSFLDGLGAPASSFQITAIRALVLAALIYPLTACYGIAGSALAAVLSVASPLPLILCLYHRAEGKTSAHPLTADTSEAIQHNADSTL
jgi:O-antigen/teichoic acid export membrane protein